MFCQRRCGSLRRQRITARSTSAGRGSPRPAGVSGSLLMTAASVEAFVSPWNGRRPVSISYSTVPNEKMSERASSRFPSACSGDM